MQLFGMGMSRSFRAVWAAEEAELDYDYIEVQFGSKEQHGALSQQYRTIQSEGKVPALVDGDLVLRESVAIVNYLAGKSKTAKLVPTDGTVERAQHEEMCVFIVTEFEQPLWTAGKHKFAIPEEYRVPDVLSKTVGFEFAKAQEALIKLIGDRPFAAGGNFTTADILLSHTIGWAQKFQFNVADELLRYRENMTSRPAYAQAKTKIKVD